MINVSVFFNGLNTREELLSFAQKLYAEKKLVKYIIIEKSKKKYSDETPIEDIINDEMNRGCLPGFISPLLGINTKSRKALQLLNNFVKENHYHYSIWSGPNNCPYKMHMTLDELLEKYQ